VKNKLEDLRNHLFAALEGLSDQEKPMPIDRALAIAEVAQVVINSAKVEVDFLRLHDGMGIGTGFVPIEPIVPGVRGALPAGKDATLRVPRSA